MLIQLHPLAAVAKQPTMAVVAVLLTTVVVAKQTLAATTVDDCSTVEFVAVCVVCCREFVACSMVADVATTSADLIAVAIQVVVQALLLPAVVAIS